MKTRQHIWLISAASLLVFIILSLIFKSVIASKNGLLLNEGYSNLRQETGKVYSIKTTGIEQFVRDNSYWDDLLQAVKVRDTAWIELKVAPTVKSFNIDNFWLLNEQGEEVYFHDSRNHPPAAILSAAAGSQLLKELKKSPFRTFFTIYNGALIQLVSAPIQPGSDQERKTPHRGYYICGRYFDATFLKQLNSLTEKTTFTITTAAAADTIERKTSLLHYYYPLRDFYGKPVSFLKARVQLDFITAYSGYLNTYLWIYLGLICLVLLACYQFLRLRVLKPISKLSGALETKNTEGFEHFKRRKDEFAGFAELIEDSFEQTRMLMQEVEARKASEAALKKSASELEKATVEKIRAEQDRLAKAEFLSTMSHEIRTPINGVIGIANLLRDENLPPHQKELVNTLLFSSGHLLSILTDILDFSKIEAGNIQFDRIAFSMKDVCNGVYNLYSSQAKEKKIDFFLLSDNRVDDYLTGDSVRLCQVLNNLVSNAIKFTSQGGVTLKYRLLQDDGAKQRIEFLVEDTGIGIEPGKQEAIFESFSQAGRSISTNYGGTGLGLTISKKIVELQGGRIALSSTPGKGSIFSFILAFEKQAHNAGRPVLLSSTKPGKLTGMKVLVAEDNKINALVLTKFLEKWDVDMRLAVNGQEALQLLEQESFHLALMDLHMPVMDGLEAIRSIRQHAMPFKNIPVIALTADATKDTRKLIFETGFDEYLSKPFNPESLFKLLQNYYKRPV